VTGYQREPELLGQTVVVIGGNAGIRCVGPADVAGLAVDAALFILAAAQVVKSRFRHRIGLSLGAYTLTQARSVVSARLCTSGCFRQIRASGAGGTLRPPD